MSRRDEIILKLISYAVVLNGVFIVAGTLARQIEPNSPFRVNDLLVSLPLISGLTLIYLGSLLNRHKQIAWMIALPVYGFILGQNLTQLSMTAFKHPNELKIVILPLIVVTALLYYRRSFTVKSDVRSFTLALRTSFLILLVSFVYGVAGYILMDTHDFRQEISLEQAAHRTIDQFDFTSDTTLHPYTRRARIFVDSLNVISAVAVGYVIISLFQPVRAKLTNQNHNREIMEKLLEKHSKNSEDFFKLWPHDKSYYFDDPHNPKAAIAYRVQRGVALVVADPVGDKKHVKQALQGFMELCTTNDWLPALIQVTEEYQSLYESMGLQLQKLGEEAVVSISHFKTRVRKEKYFRQIGNKFEKHGYTTELLSPPHSPGELDRLNAISKEWLSLPGRQERGFMMGYYNEAYIQQCKVVVARDQEHVIQGFINKVPTYDREEANYDLLRQSSHSLGNTNDFLLMSFINFMDDEDYKRVNLGLSPLTGLDKNTKDRSIIDSTLRFSFANGDRFYSFSGLHRFKAKYEPEWRNRYIAYRGGIRNFTRALYALNKALSRLK